MTAHDHFQWYPTPEALAERRQWLPPADEAHTASKAFWRQFDDAEQLTKDIEKKFGDGAIWFAFHPHADEHSAAYQSIDSALEAAHSKVGIIGVFDCVETTTQPLLCTFAEET